METTRRGFLGTLAAAPVGFQQIGKSLAGQGLPMPNAIRPGGPVSTEDCISPEYGVDPWEFYRTFGVPDFVKDELRKRCQPDRCDPDLDVLRAVSPVAKYRIQHKRNVERGISSRFDEVVLRRVRNEFVRKHGLNWWR